MRRRLLLATVTGATASVAGCSGLTTSIRDDASSSHHDEGETEGTLERPTDEPAATERLGESVDGDPHVVLVRTVEESRDLEVRVLTGGADEPLHAEQYALADGDHVRFELLEPDAYTIELLEDGEMVGDPYEIEADWFEYDCPLTVVELGAGGRFSASTEPDGDACS